MSSRNHIIRVNLSIALAINLTWYSPLVVERSFQLRIETRTVSSIVALSQRWSWGVCLVRTTGVRRVVLLAGPECELSVCSSIAPRESGGGVLGRLRGFDLRSWLRIRGDSTREPPCHASLATQFPPPSQHPPPTNLDLSSSPNTHSFHSPSSLLPRQTQHCHFKRRPRSPQALLNQRPAQSQTHRSTSN